MIIDYKLLNMAINSGLSTLYQQTLTIIEAIPDKIAMLDGSNQLLINT